MLLGRDYKIRGVEEDDHSFIMNAWIFSMEKSFFAAHGHDNKTHQRARIHKLFDRDAIRIRVACAADDDTEMFGFIVSEPENNAVHFCYVKQPYRRWGIATELLRDVVPSGDVVITQYSVDTRELRKAGKLPTNIRYNPYWFEENA